MLAKTLKLMKKNLKTKCFPEKVVHIECVAKKQEKSPKLENQIKTMCVCVCVAMCVLAKLIKTNKKQKIELTERVSLVYGQSNC